MIRNSILALFLKDALLGNIEDLSIGIKYKLNIPYINNKREQSFIFDGNLLAVSNKTKFTQIESKTSIIGANPSYEIEFNKYIIDNISLVTIMRDSRYDNLITSIRDDTDDSMYTIAHKGNIHKIMPTLNQYDGIELQLYNLMSGKLVVYYNDENGFNTNIYFIKVNNRSSSFLFYVELFDENNTNCGYISIKKLFKF